jgi:hypothetical protein
MKRLNNPLAVPATQSLQTAGFGLAPSARLRDEDRVVFEQNSGCIAELNEVGFILVKAAELRMPVLEVIQALAAHYSAAPDDLLLESSDFYAKMLERGFLLDCSHG